VTSVTESTRPSMIDSPHPSKLGRCLVAVVAGLLLIIVSPVLIEGGLLADEYIICLRPVREGYEPYIRAIWQDTGIVRPARFIELFLISKCCTQLPYGLVMLVPLALKFAAAFLLYGLLRDLRLRDPWPYVGVAVWLLEPLGTEAALWPAALHVLLGLVLALAALRLYHRGFLAWAALASVGAALSAEQVIFALPVAVWLTAQGEHRSRATLTATTVVTVILIAYATWPGENPRQALTLAERLKNVFARPEWYLFFPAVGLGLYSGALGFAWALPYSVAVVLVSAVAGALVMPRLLREHTALPRERRTVLSSILRVGIVLLLVNLPLIVTQVGYSARTFTPTWLVLSAAVAGGAAQVHWRRVRLLGVLGGTFAAFALLSLALSVSVRVRTDKFDRAAAQWIANRTHDGSVVAVCDVERTAVNPAPLGAFHLHAFHSTWGAWIEYHTGRVVEIRRSGERYWGSRCPDLGGADLVISFPELVTELRQRGDR